MFLQNFASSLMLAIPLLLLFSASASRITPRWQLSQTVNALVLVASLAIAAIAFIINFTYGGVEWNPWSWINQSLIAPVMLVLVTFIGLIITRYSRNYLAGEPNQNRYLRQLQFTLAAVSIVILSNHLLVLLSAWVMISLGLHDLLMFYSNRTRAVLAAHKKFLFARISEVSLLISFVLLYAQHDTWIISEIVAAYPVESLSAIEQWAAVFLALTALLKCAQIPAHGWLMQVMEAPTPVSALLHAGVVNLGGYLLLLFAPLLMLSSSAQWLLLIVAGLTMGLASLVMMTRVSIKVRLAWSTSAQMALMLIECALGLFELALLHLLAHSCYKAYAFLNSGSAAKEDVSRQLAPSVLSKRSTWITAAIVATGLILIPMLLIDTQGPFSPWLIMGAAITLLLAERSSQSRLEKLTSVLPLATIFISAYVIQKYAAGYLVTPLEPSAGWLADAWVISLFVLLFCVYWVLLYFPQSLLAKRFAISLFAGFYLDEWTTRTTQRIWPVKLPTRANAKQLQTFSEEISR